jgi:opacity protein-like surface antigen
MKLKSILVAATMLLATAAQAGGYTDLQYYQEENRNTHKDNIKYAVTVGNKTADAWDYSLKLETSQAEVGNGSISEGVEVRVRKGLELGVLKPYVGVRLGEKIGSSSHFTHYAVDAGTKFPLFGSLTGDVGYRYRNAFDTTNAYQSNRYHAALAYALTKQDSLAVRYSQAYGDTAEEKNSWRFTYTRSF